ncbi:hypothetical protein ADK55_20035 [Streptomyces sp. WM4235]|uniref:hypothetical protein n=1 Tax=Streptomyces sp. WM4235 TaxID=1415551 RepID=UPI0006ADC380|nr:hypothetical protein [Streptomyces sp. WM4235]KOU47988.1 hypothetical protein ADK55_20035 [Streptomyces sp. WM4235]
MAVRAVPTEPDTSEFLSAQAWRITSGSPAAEEVAALAVALAAVMRARAAEAIRLAEEEQEQAAARWTPSAARRRAATSWAAGAQPTWANTA